MLKLDSSQPCRYDAEKPRSYEVWTHEREGESTSVLQRRHPLRGDPSAIAKRLKFAYGATVPSLNSTLNALWQFSQETPRAHLRSLVTHTLVQICEGPHDDGSNMRTRQEGFSRHVWLPPGARSRLFHLAADPHLELNDKGIGLVTDSTGTRRRVVAVPMTTDETAAYDWVLGAELGWGEDDHASPNVLIHRIPKHERPLQLEHMQEMSSTFGGM